MKPDKKLEACTPDALGQAVRAQEEHEAKIKAAHEEKAGYELSLEEARGKLAALDAKEREVQALRLSRQEAIAKGQDHAAITARIESSEQNLSVLAKGRGLLEDQEAAYLKAVKRCEDYLAALATDLVELQGEVARIKAGVLANAYNDLGRRMAETVRELRDVCFAGTSNVFDGAPRPHGRYWGDGSLARIPALRMDWEGVPAEDAYHMRFH